MEKNLLSVQLYQQQMHTENVLHGKADELPSSNPLFLIDTVAWGEHNFYIEDRFDHATGAQLPPGPILLSNIQSRIIRAATLSYVDTEAVKSYTLPLVDDDASIFLYNILYIYIKTPPSPSSSRISRHANAINSAPLARLHYTNNTVYRGMPALELPDSVVSRQLHHHLARDLFIIIMLLPSVSPPSSNRTIVLPLSPVGIGLLASHSTLQPSIINAMIDDINRRGNYVERLRNLLVTSTRYRWSNVVYSCPKKSGKTRIAAMVASHTAYRSIPYSEIYCLANDGKQSADRVLMAIKKSVDLSQEFDQGSDMATWRQVRMRVELPGKQFIEAVPVDPEGEAGSQPTGTFWSEMWGYNLAVKERLWTELTIPPTRYGRAIRWVESYAGYEGESPVLWNLYLQGVDRREHSKGKGVRHPDFSDLPVYVNNQANMFCYWDHEPRMVWQTPEYYRSESTMMVESEFRKVHKNEWVSSLEQAIPIARWDTLKESLPRIKDGELLVLGLDLSVSGGCCALVTVSKHPHDDNRFAIRDVGVWEAVPGVKIDYRETVIPEIKRICLNPDGTTNNNVVCIAYDEYQAHLMATDLQKELGIWFEQFSQGKGTPVKPGRPVGDKMFFDLIMSGRVAHDGNPILREHVNNASAHTTKEGHYMRFIKKSETGNIDALVAASMAICVLSRLNV